MIILFYARAFLLSHRLAATSDRDAEAAGIF